MIKNKGSRYAKNFLTFSPNSLKLFVIYNPDFTWIFNILLIYKKLI